MTGITRMVKHRDPDYFAFVLTRIIHPFRFLPPSLVFVLSALSIPHASRAFGFLRALLLRIFEPRRESHRERPLLCIAECHLCLRLQSDVEVDLTVLWSSRFARIKRHRPMLHQQHITARGPIDIALDRASLAAALHLHISDHLLAGIAVVDRRFIGPEIEAVDLVLTEPEPAMMGMVLALALMTFIHRPVAGYYRAVGRAHRPQIRLGVILALNDEIRKRFTIDLHRNLVRALRDLYLPAQRETGD